MIGDRRPALTVNKRKSVREADGCKTSEQRTLLVATVSGVGSASALVVLLSLVASGQITLRRIDGWRKISAVLSQHTAVAA